MSHVLVTQVKLMDIRCPPQYTTMFTLRIWQESVEKGEQEWRGRLQRLPDGDVQYFRGWPALIAQLERELGGL